MADEPQGDVHRPSALDLNNWGSVRHRVHQQLATENSTRGSGELYDITIDTLPTTGRRSSDACEPSR